MRKVKVGIIGTGNIGTDLLFKIKKSSILECGMFAGRNSDSKGIAIAQSMGIQTSIDSIKAIEENPDCCEIVFDATSAKVHRNNAVILKNMGKFTIDMTPSLVGMMCIPAINIDECLNEMNVNMVTCGGQATVPIIYAISQAQKDIRYAEIVASISSKSAGSGTRANIDEFTQTTRDAICAFTGIEKAKAIITLNPADPPVLMHNTVYLLIEKPNIDIIRDSVRRMVKNIQEYVPGYELIVEPVFESGRVTTMVQVMGAGDYLPKYSGNLDIINCAGVRLAEHYAKVKLLKGM